MFTIKFMKDDGYTAFECKSYGVSWKVGGQPVVSMNLSEDGPARHYEVEKSAYIMNALGKTIDHLSYEVAASPLSGDKAI